MSRSTATLDELRLNEVAELTVDAGIRYAANIGREWFLKTFAGTINHERELDFKSFKSLTLKRLDFGMKWFAGEPARRLGGAADVGFTDIWLSAGLDSRAAAVRAAAHEGYHAAFDRNEENAELVGRAAVKYYNESAAFKFVRGGARSLEALRMPLDPALYLLTFADNTLGLRTDLRCYRADQIDSEGHTQWRPIGLG